MDKLNLSLDDLIKKGEPKGGRKGGKGGGGAMRKEGGAGRGARQAAAPYQKPKSPIVKPSVAATTLSALSSQQALKVAGGLTTGTKLKIANLDANVSTQDIEELFTEMGDLKSAEVVTAANGISRGFAFVVYKRKADAQKAIETYNGVPLDGKPLRITMATGPSPAAASAAAAVQVSATVNGKRAARTVTVAAPQAGRGAAVQDGGARGRGRGRGRGGGRGRGKADEPKPTQGDLDADLDAYR